MSANFDPIFGNAERTRKLMSGMNIPGWRTGHGRPADALYPSCEYYVNLSDGTIWWWQTHTFIQVVPTVGQQQQSAGLSFDDSLGAFTT